MRTRKDADSDGEWKRKSLRLLPRANTIHQHACMRMPLIMCADQIFFEFSPPQPCVVGLWPSSVTCESRFCCESGQIRKNRNFPGLNLCTSHFLVFGCLRDQDVVRSLKKVAENIPGPKITRYYLCRHLHRVIGICPLPDLKASCFYFGWKKH